MCNTFFCFYCLDRIEFNATKLFNGTIDGVYGHWLAKHATESLSKPFKFYAVAFVSCFHCNHIGTYHDLVKHHNENHIDQQFVIVNQTETKKCGICHFNAGDLIEHFKVQHDLKTIPKFFNPIYYSEKRINELLAINVHRKHQCHRCNGIFETQDEITAHLRISHSGECVQSSEFIDNKRTVNHLICGYCQQNVDASRLLNHFREHSYKFLCTKCPYQSDDLSDLMCHEKIVHNIDITETHFGSFPTWMKNKFFNTDEICICEWFSTENVQCN